MKHEKISIKWKIFFYLLVFTGILLTVLWLVQICYLDKFYKKIKSQEALELTSEVIAVLQSDSQNIEEQIDALAAQNNMIVFVTDTDGNTIYSAEYIPNSRLCEMPQEMIQKLYEAAKSKGGSTKLEFEGDIGKNDFQNPQDVMNPDAAADAAGAGNIPDAADVTGAGAENAPDAAAGATGAGNSPDAADVAGAGAENAPGAANGAEQETAGMPVQNGFMQNHGQERIESVIYVNVVSIDGSERILFVNAQLTPVDATVNTLRAELVWITVIMIVLSLGIALLISRKVSRSLIGLNASAKEMAGGNFDVHFDGTDYREVAELSDTLNMTARELGKSERLRRELIANVSHDLRTPLTMIIAYAEVMRDLPGENSPENVQVVIDEAERLTNLVNDMLDISKLQAGVLEKNVTVYNLTESIQSVFARYNKLKEQDGYKIDFSYDQMVMVEADEYKIFQVIYNLVNNAINYTGDDKQIWVRQIVREDGYVRIEVTDSGEGIAPEALPYVWDRYYKVDKTHKRAVMGTGLGLSIVKNILELHDARYGVESEVGKGSTFWFELKVYQIV